MDEGVFRPVSRFQLGNTIAAPDEDQDCRDGKERDEDFELL